MTENTNENGNGNPKRVGIGDIMNDLPALLRGSGIVGIPNQKEPKGNGNKNL